MRSTSSSHPPGRARGVRVGSWVFVDYSSSWVGFRVAEALQGLGDADAVGRTPAVSGALVANGSIIESALIEVELTTIGSDQPRRDPAIQRALDTVELPTGHPGDP